MKEFIGIFFTCMIISWIISFFFLGLIIENIWALLIFISFILAVFITVFIKQQIRLEDLEKKVEKLGNNKED